ncbi:uncharacterized protein LOC106635985 [Copidosoma floridanum]|uniref:uncharacterized protein LOC106635985 n=1 Tax=Copidosoma floridanum TaxID=29053 RepID=UPI0006C9CC35|nr:uncharacterized protein LOC106635985 [Copidosoma floridanum]
MMLGTSLKRCSLIVLIFANLLVSGLTSSDSKNGTVVVAVASTLQPLSGLGTGATMTPTIPKTETDPSAADVTDRPAVTGKSDEATDNPAAVDKSVNDTARGEDKSSPTAVVSTEGPKSATTTVKSNSTESEEKEMKSVTETTVASATVEGIINVTMSLEPSAGNVTNGTENNEPIGAAWKEQLAVPHGLGDMPSRLVAISMAIAFAIVVVIVYVGLLAWRRYLEVRYGSRQLLVNNLEFDTNDLRHFEL